MRGMREVKRLSGEERRELARATLLLIPWIAFVLAFLWVMGTLQRALGQ